LARAREFDEPFYFTSASEKDIARFVEAAQTRGFDTRRGQTFWHLSAKCDTARAVRTLAQLFREATHIKLRLVGIGSGDQDLPWLRAVDQAVLLPDSPETAGAIEQAQGTRLRARTMGTGAEPGAIGWNQAVLNIIGQS
jgi:predicted mannosyl-3-phosphoglycerate phosphatase (HAD superfamily)